MGISILTPFLTPTFEYDIGLQAVCGVGFQFVQGFVFLLLAEVGIDGHGGFDVGVAKELLGGVDVYVCFKQDCGVAVAEDVGC